jgi:uncharacterized protein
MHYYIDGYNLMFRILRATENFQFQREKIIANLSNKIQVLGLNVTLIFDAKYRKGGLSRTYVYPIEVCYTAEGETADEFILSELKGHSKPNQHTVVTSDKKLSHLVKLLHSHTETVEQFITWLNKRYKNKLLKSKPSLIPQKPINLPVKNLLPSQIIVNKIDLTSSIKDTFNFYQEEFEKRLKEQVAKESLKKNKIKADSPAEPYLSDMQRWLKAFENNEDPPFS